MQELEEDVYNKTYCMFIIIQNLITKKIYTYSNA